MTASSEEAKAELAEAEKKLADAKAELADAKKELADAKKELKEKETQQEQVEKKLTESKQADQADPANTVEVQRLERKLQRLNAALEELELSVASKSASVRSKEDVVRRLESQLSVMAGTALASSGGERKTLRRQIAHRDQHCILLTCLSVPVCACV